MTALALADPFTLRVYLFGVLAFGVFMVWGSLPRKKKS